MRLWLAGTLISNVGSWMQRTAQDWLVLTQLTHHSGFATGVTVGLQFLPLLLFSAHAGVLVDRLPKRNILVVTQLVMCLSALTLSLLVFTHCVQLWMVYACAFWLGCGTAFDNPTRQAFISEIVPPSDVANAVTLNNAAMNLSRMVGPAAAGLVIAAWNTGPAFLINAVSFLAVLYALVKLRVGELHEAKRQARPGNAREGLRYIWRRPDLLMILACTSLVSTFSMNNAITTALMSTTVFHRGASEYGILGTILAIGSLCASLVIARSDRPRLGLVSVAALGLGVAMLVNSLMPSYLPYLLTLFPCGFFNMIYLNTCAVSMQVGTDTAMHGRVLALYGAIQLGTFPIGGPAIGWIGEAFGARWSVIAGALAALLAAVIAAAILRLRPNLSLHYLDALSRQEAAIRSLTPGEAQ